MFSVSSGGRAIAKKTLAPHTKITIVISSGTTVHVISSMRPPWICAPISSAERRWNLTAKYTIRPPMRSEKNTASARRKKYSASTRDAIVEAASGNKGVPVHISAPERGNLRFGAWGAAGGSSAEFPATSFLASQHYGDERHQRKHVCVASQPERLHDDEPVPARHRVVVVAIEQQRVGGIPDAALRRFDDAEPEIARAVLDAEQVARETAVRRQHDHAAR